MLKDTTIFSLLFCLGVPCSKLLLNNKSLPGFHSNLYCEYDIGLALSGN